MPKVDDKVPRRQGSLSLATSLRTNNFELRTTQNQEMKNDEDMDTDYDQGPINDSLKPR
jgi:hypothetical protein